MKKILLALLLSSLCLAACDPQSAPVEKPSAGTEAEPACVVTPPDEVMACTMEWRPVSGCDGVTYSNACAAKAAGVPDCTEGECKAANLD